MARAAGGGNTSRARGRRRAGDVDARAQIVAAATKEFTSSGYDATSMRAIARRAGVDPALVHHYFDDKPTLFAESVRSPVRPDRIVNQVMRGPRDAVGVNFVTAALTAIESGGDQNRIIGLVRTALGHDFAATMLRQFLVREVIGRIAGELGVDDGEMRATAAASQIVGIFIARYGVKLEPLASASIDEVAQRLGPAIQWHLTGQIDSLDRGRAQPE